LLTYPATIPLSTRTLTHLADQLRAHRAARGTRWRRLDPGRQALLVLAHLRNGDTYTRLATGFGVGVATVYRYIRETLDLLATAAPTLDQIVYRASRLLWVILDGTLIPIDRVADDRPYYSGKHKRHGINVQILADTRGALLWASPALRHPRPDRRQTPRHPRRPSQVRRRLLRRQRLPCGWTHHRGPVPASTAQTVRESEEGQPQPRPQPGTRRTRRRHPQDLETPDQAPLLPTPSDHDHRRHPRPSNRGRPGPLKLERAPC
jgi:hypothetical protein